MKKVLVLFAAGSFFLASCGGGSNEGNDTLKQLEKKNTTEAPKAESPAAEEAPAEATPADASSVILELAGNDQMQYDKKELRVKEGQKVTLNFSHIGKLPVEAMGHNFVLLKQGTDVAAFATSALEFKDNGYIPEATDAIIVHTNMIGGGEKTSITFDAPSKGTYTYICSFPGHYAMMQGQFIVE